jgi:diacylglycerol O-acyltransferase-1
MYNSTIELITHFHKLLKLAIPSTYVWLLLFYSSFHLFLNITAEVLKFADREFYGVSLPSQNYLSGFV